ncbi:MAG: 2'-5' RNA ligase family protein [Gemmatales bacterium]|nr:2'-5' RNA ligase family protein [Gemmatales bacterium]MDW7993984.1 2'-5' RNA ligase family protein [Gemmatales bacterium]
MVSASWGKTHHSALVIIPPESVWPTIQTLRQKYDRQFHRWMPHINVLYPFIAEERFAEAAELAGQVLRRVPRFILRFERFRWFIHGSGTATVWLEPAPGEAVRGLHSVLLEIFPQCDDLTRFPQGYTPHLSIGQTSAVGVEQFAARLQTHWQPLEFWVNEVAFIARTQDTPFQVKCTVPLSSRP